MTMRRLFTLAEAEALLPRIRALATEMRSAKRTLDAARRPFVDVQRKSVGNGHVADEDGLSGHRAEYEAAQARLREAVAAIQALGVEVKDLDLGLVDFPSERDGRVVYLCWRLGEDRIEYWHELDSGFAGRKPI